MTEQFLAFTLGVGVSLLADWGFHFWKRARESNEKSNARKLLKEYGYTPHLYLASMGEDNIDIRYALDVFSHSGHIVLDRGGHVVGRILPNVDLGNPHQQLRLVVDNTSLPRE